MIEEMDLWELFDAVDEIMDKEIYRDDDDNETEDDLLLCEMNELL
jgi:hypothetical protein